MATYPVPSRIRRDLSVVEQALRQVAASAEGELRRACESTLRAGGKRLRPALVLVSGIAGSYDLPSLIPHAAAVELLHTASLVHDDILDGAQTRRGFPSVYAKWGDTLATATGDFLFSKAFEMLASSSLPKAPRILADTALDLTRGELLQRQGTGRVDVTKDEYLERIRAKTGSLFRASCHLGALASGARPKDVAALALYGERLGMAFQIFDDVLDISGETEALGKAVGADLRDGTLTLPMMLAAERLGEDEWLLEVFQRGGEDRVREAMAIVAKTDSAARAKEIAASYVHSAIESVAGLESDGLRSILLDIGNYVIQRYH